jgi:hypothetical protein
MTVRHLNGHEYIGDDPPEDVTHISDRDLVLRAADAALAARQELADAEGRIMRELSEVKTSLKNALADFLRKRDSDRPVSHHDLEARLAEETTNPGVVSAAVAAGIAAGMATAPKRDGDNPLMVVVTTIVQAGKWVGKAKTVWAVAGIAGTIVAQYVLKLLHWLK